MIIYSKKCSSCCISFSNKMIPLIYVFLKETSLSYYVGAVEKCCDLVGNPSLVLINLEIIWLEILNCLILWSQSIYAFPDLSEDSSEFLDDGRLCESVIHRCMSHYAFICCTVTIEILLVYWLIRALVKNSNISFQQIS